MTWIALAWALSRAELQPPSAQTSLWGTWLTTGRIVDRDDVHVGVRIAAFLDPEGDGGSLEGGVGATIQVTLRALP